MFGIQISLHLIKLIYNSNINKLSFNQKFEVQLFMGPTATTQSNPIQTQPNTKKKQKANGTKQAEQTTTEQTHKTEQAKQNKQN